MQKERIYVCHTFYHVYVACLKELNLEKERRGKASLVLSRMSNDFGNLKARAEKSGLFEAVYWFDEKPFTFFEELTELKKDTGSLPGNLRNRMRFCKRLGELEEPYVPVNFREYGDIYVFCDSDPIGYYLSWKKIYYHAVEDGLDCIRYYDTAHYDNRGHFRLKAAMAALGFIFIQNGYGRYCIDMEVNSIEALDHPISRMVEVPREKLVEGLDGEGRDILICLFIENRQELEDALPGGFGPVDQFVQVAEFPDAEVVRAPQREHRDGGAGATEVGAVEDRRLMLPRERTARNRAVYPAVVNLPGELGAVVLPFCAPDQP